MLVGAAIAAAAFIAWKVTVPDPVPNFALKAAAIYRIEVGAAAFLGLYLISMAFALALNNRGFSEIGMSGLKAQDLANRGQQLTLEEHEKALESVNVVVSGIEELTESQITDLRNRVIQIEENSTSNSESKPQ
jgi:hypothetical protein